MKSFNLIFLLLFMVLFSCNRNADSHVVINEFAVPLESAEEFENAVSNHVSLIRQQKGLDFSGVFKSSNEEKTITYFTVVKWKSVAYYEKAKIVIQNDMKASDFDPVAFNNRLGILLTQRDFREIEYVE